MGESVGVLTGRMVDLDEVRRRLDADLREVASQHSRIAAHLRNEDRELPDDWPDMAQFMENDEVLELLEERTRHRVESTLRAIARIDDGTYATCTGCGQTISDERLDLLPATPVCASCS